MMKYIQVCFSIYLLLYVMKSDCKVWQINLHHANNSSVLLQQTLSSETCCVALLQEPYCQGNRVLHVPKNTKSYSAVLDKCVSPRAAVLVSKDISSRLLPDFCDRDTVTVACDLPGPNGHLNTVWWVSAYMPGDSHDDPPPQMVMDIVHHCNDKGLPLIIGCDANAHHEAWNSSDSNPRGESLLEFFITSHLTLCNRGHEPTFVVQNRKEVLDLTLTNNFAVDLVRNWRVSLAPSLSDHRYIRFEITVSVIPIYTNYRNIKRTDWDAFSDQCSRALENLECDNLCTCAEVDLVANKVNDILTNALDSVCPMKKVRLTGKPNRQVWWTRELAILQKQARKAHRLAMRSGSEDSWDAYRQAQRKFKTATRNAKRSSWKSFCQDTTSMSATAKLVHVLKKDKSTKLETVQKDDASYTSSPAETLQVMMEKHYPDSVPVHNESVIKCNMQQGCRTDLVNEIVTYDLVQLAITSFKPWKAPGHDMIYPKMIQEAGSHLIPFLLYKACLRLGFVPKVWTKARVVFIPKPGKDSYFKADSYRPITLTSFF